MRQLYFKLEDAESLLFSDGVTRVETATDYLGWQAAQIQGRGLARVWNSDHDLRARVNHGRWITDCLACYQGIYTHPVWKLACCANCGAVYRSVEFPAAVAEITELLLARPDRTKQNWEPGESVLKLKAENFLYRVAA